MNIFEILKSVLLGIVEGITEWLPISSTGHMIFVNELMNNTGFTDSDLYIYVIQLGAILAIVTLYFSKLNPFSFKKTKEERVKTWQLWFKILIACIPAAVVGLLLDDYMENLENWKVVSAMLIVYGIAFIVVEKLKKKTTVTSFDNFTYKTAILIGAFQMLSVIPGTSRSGATILGAIILGCSREIAAEFSFFLAVPVMIGVSFIKLIKNDTPLTTENAVILLIGMAVAYLVSLFVIKALMEYIKKHDFTAFGWYRIALGILMILFFTLRLYVFA
ncbi:MAG: undecaprenyl-diphosphate phosphatase [Clostridiales bacterium]|nr:undecaprenyl-diphosphate phosphatase [Clostridia bacterium]MCR5353283.1 undecaprenyl-diphosphate phosphatase [Clostridiales bacterium]